MTNHIVSSLLSVFTYITFFILTTFLWGYPGTNFYPNFTDKKTEDKSENGPIVL